jgi:hypothetical protein
MYLYIRVIALMLCRGLNHFASKHPHLSVVQIVKDHRCAKPLSPSAAQKKDYEPFPLIRQALRLLLPNRLTLPTPPKHPPLQERGAFYGFKTCRQYLVKNKTHHQLSNFSSINTHREALCNRIQVVIIDFRRRWVLLAATLVEPALEAA